MLVWQYEKNLIKCFPRRQPDPSNEQRLYRNRLQIRASHVLQAQELSGYVDCQEDFSPMIPLVMMLLFLKEPEKEAAAAVTAGNAVIAGFSNSTYNLIGLLICLLISPIEKKLGKHMLWVMNFIFTCGMALIVFVPKVPVIIIGAGLCGAAFNSVMALLQLYSGKTASARQATLVSTMLIAAMSLGNFASVYFIDICQSIFRTGNDVQSTYIGSMLLYLILTVISLVIRVAPGEYYKR